MKKGLILLSLILGSLIYPADPVFASVSYLPDNQKSIVEQILGALNNIFYGSEVSSSAKVEISGSRLELIRLLNSYEMLVRVDLTGRDIYLSREKLLDQLTLSKQLVEAATLPKTLKADLVARTDEVITVLNMDLVDNPQDLVKEVLIKNLDALEAEVLHLSEFDATEVLKLVRQIEKA